MREGGKKEREGSGGWTFEKRHTREVGGVVKFFGAEEQKERIILHYSNDRSHKRMGEETTLHSISSAFCCQ